MKSLIFSLCLVISTTALFARNTGSTGFEHGPKKELFAQQQTMRKLVERNVFFPSCQGEKPGGSVDVTLQVFPDGEVRIIRIHAENTDLREFVLEQLQSLKVDKEAFAIGQVFRYRFTFKQEA